MDSVQLGMEGQTSAAPARQKGISGSTIKIIAVVAMLIDHIAAVILMRQIFAKGFLDLTESGNMDDIVVWLMENGALYYGYQIMRYIGRLGFPIFCFLLVEGFQRTRDVRKYALRLAAFALISEIPFDLATCGKVFYTGYQNVYFTLLFGLLALCCMDYVSKHELSKAVRIIFCVAGVLAPDVYIMTLAYDTIKGKPGTFLLTNLLGVLVTGAVLLIYGKVKGGQKAQLFCAELSVLVLWMCVADLVETDYAGMGVLTIGVMYLCRKRKVIAMLAGCIVLTIMSVSEITAFFTLIPIALYNGSRGLKMKYFFYIFYPAHLALLYLISVWLGLGGVAVL